MCKVTANGCLQARLWGWGWADPGGGCGGCDVRCITAHQLSKVRQCNGLLRLEGPPPPVQQAPAIHSIEC